MAKTTSREPGAPPHFPEEAIDKLADEILKRLRSRDEAASFQTDPRPLEITLKFNPTSRALMDELAELRGTDDYGRIIQDALQLAKAVWREEKRGFSRIVLQDPSSRNTVTLNKKNQSQRILEMLR